MRGFFTLFPLLLIGMVSACSESNPVAETAGSQASMAWLSIVDSGSYAASWQETAPAFQAQVTESDWVNTASGVSDPLGTLKSRLLAGTEYATSLPGAPDGEYVVTVFNTTFENKQEAIETVTTVKSEAGDWRVTGYFIR